MEKLDGDVAKRCVSKIASHVGEAASGEVRFAIPERQMNFGFVANGVNNVSRAE
jgi:hypothetical protein